MHFLSFGADSLANVYLVMNNLGEADRRHGGLRKSKLLGFKYDKHGSPATLKRTSGRSASDRRVICATSLVQLFLPVASGDDVIRRLLRPTFSRTASGGFLLPDIQTLSPVRYCSCMTSFYAPI